MQTLCSPFRDVSVAQVRELLDADLELKGWIWTLGGAYSAWQREGSHLDLLAGARLFSLDTELELTGRVEGRLRALGHAGTIRVRRPGSDITMGVVVSGDSSLYPTSFNGCVGAEGPYPTSASGGGWKKLAPGDTVMLDLVTVHNGYHSDNTRTFFVGDSVPDEALKAHAFCLEILREIENIRDMTPGFTGVISDLGGPTANMWRLHCKDPQIESLSAMKNNAAVHYVRGMKGVRSGEFEVAAKFFGFHGLQADAHKIS